MSSKQSIDAKYPLTENKQQLISSQIRSLMKDSSVASLDKKLQIYHLEPDQMAISIAKSLEIMASNSDVNGSVDIESSAGFAGLTKQYLRKLTRPMFALQTAHNDAATILGAQLVKLVEYNERQQTNLYLRSLQTVEEKFEVLISSIEKLETKLDSKDRQIEELERKINQLETNSQ